MPIDFDAMKKQQVKTTYPRRSKPPLVKKTMENSESLPKSDPLPHLPTEEEMESKRKLIKQLFDENSDLPLEEMLLQHLNITPTKDGKKMGKTISPLKGIREGLEDMLNIQQLKDLVMGFRNMKKDNGNNQNNNQQQNNNNNNNMMSFLPLLQQMQNGNGQTDPTTLMLMMNMMGGQNNNNNSGGNDMGQLYFMITMMNMMNQNGNQKNQNSNGNNQQNQPNLNADIIKAIYAELQNVMSKQGQQSQQSTIDPNMMLLMNMMNKQGQNQNIKPDNTVEVLLDKFNSMMQNNQSQQMAVIMQQNNDKWERGMEMIAGALNHERPEERFMNSFKMFREITGDQRQKSEKEMEYDLRREELILKRQDRGDLLATEERQIIREDAKSARILDIGAVVLDKVIGKGLGSLVGDLMSAKKDSGGDREQRRGRTKAQKNEKFDSSLLDEL